MSVEEITSKKAHERKELYGLEPEMSLQNVNFASRENSYLNEHYQENEEDE
ncbi:hypothetical protein [Heyndrickxia oleronia]|uniref:hypothetical protein n=1 Tax=Heyndrickxia oleronia TaxID=38875 RepID=UPI001B267571|nr:hypothetical protein [Heyndrickxia oleronia]GIN39498.1 hypothetical protein J19TS1_24470 [Heyndrickxia oleronia]